MSAGKIEQFQELFFRMKCGESVPEKEVNTRVPGLNDVIAELDRPFKPGEYLLGVDSEQGEPRGFNVFDSQQGNFLVIGDSRSGKTDLLRAIAVQANKQNASVDIVTGKLWEWEGCFGDTVRVHKITSHSRAGFLGDYTSQLQLPESSSIAWPQKLLVIDSLALFVRWMEENDPMGPDLFRHLLTEGRKRGIMTVTSLNPDRYTGERLQLDRWVSLFSNRLFGFTTYSNAALALGGSQASFLEYLTPGLEFRWLVNTPIDEDSEIHTNRGDFWLPRVANG